MTVDVLSRNIALLTPEIILAVGAMALLMLGVFLKESQANRLVYILTIVLLLVAAIAALFWTPGEGLAFNGAFIMDPLALFSKVAILLIAAIGLLMARPYLVEEKLLKIEFPILALLAVTGMAMMVSALLPLIVKFIATFGGELTRITINNWFVFSFAPVVILISIVVAVALSRGSRGARWALAAMSGLMLVVAWRIVVAFSGSSLPFPMNDMVFAGFVVLSLVTAIAVGDRFTGLKHEHDAAQMRAIRMGHMANTDGLTGLANRRAFDMIRTLKAGQGLLVADIDQFKQVNDREGHRVGDAVLCKVAGLFQSHLPAMDGREDDDSPGCVYRLGGEEFAAIVEVMEEHQLIALADRLREIVGRSGGEEGTAGLPQVTISLGVVLGRGQMMHEAFGAADRALYRAKREGRNCVRIGDADDCNADARVSQGSMTFGRAGA